MITSIVGPIIKLTRAIATLTASVDNIKERLNAETAVNQDIHQRLYIKTGKHDERITALESRVSILEDKFE